MYSSGYGVVACGSLLSGKLCIWASGTRIYGGRKALADYFRRIVYQEKQKKIFMKRTERYWSALDISNGKNIMCARK